MRYSVRATRQADDDVDRAASWLSRHVSPLAAARWQARIIKAVHSLASKPERCPEADEAAELGFELRVLLSGRRPHVYRILFAVEGNSVNVLRILHSARDRIDADDI